MIALVLLAAAFVGGVLLWWQRPRSPWVGVLFLAVALIPAGAVALASALGAAWGCVVNEAGTGAPCFVGGWDASPLLYDLFMSGWWMLLSLPAGAALVLVWWVVRRRSS